MKISFGNTMLVTVTGIVIVFIVLILLVLIMVLFGKVASSGRAKRGEEAPQKTVPVKNNNHMTPPPVSLASGLPAGDDDELIAVIAAAVQALDHDSGKRYVIRSVRPALARPVWASAGIYENTRPF